MLRKKKGLGMGGRQLVSGSKGRKALEETRLNYEEVERLSHMGNYSKEYPGRCRNSPGQGHDKGV